MCTKLIEKKYCYKHRPPFGKELCDGDKKIMKLGGEVAELFKLGEMVGYNSALERKIIYGFVVSRREKNRSYQVSVTQNASKLLEVSHGKLYRINGYVNRGWDSLKRVKKLYDSLEKNEKKRQKAIHKMQREKKTINWDVCSIRPTECPRQILVLMIMKIDPIQEDQFFLKWSRVNRIAH